MLKNKVKTLQVRVKEYLKGLGTSASGVAATLKRRGYRGGRNSWEHCPLAMALRKRFARNVEHVGVDDVEVDITSRHTLMDHQIPLPAACKNFIKKFDKGGFPQLS